MLILIRLDRKQKIDPKNPIKVRNILPSISYNLITIDNNNNDNNNRYWIYSIF
jgi:hypothetical protein